MRPIHDLNTGHARLLFSLRVSLTGQVHRRSFQLEIITAPQHTKLTLTRKRSERQLPFAPEVRLATDGTTRTPARSV